MSKNDQRHTSEITCFNYTSYLLVTDVFLEEMVQGEGGDGGLLLRYSKSRSGPNLRQRDQNIILRTVVPNPLHVV